MQLMKHVGIMLIREDSLVSPKKSVMLTPFDEQSKAS